MSVTGESTLDELKSYIAKNGLKVKTNVGGRSKRTKDDIYKDILEVEFNQRSDEDSASDSPEEAAFTTPSKTTKSKIQPKKSSYKVCCASSNL